MKESLSLSDLTKTNIEQEEKNNKTEDVKVVNAVDILPNKDPENEREKFFDEKFSGLEAWKQRQLDGYNKFCEEIDEKILEEEAGLDKEDEILETESKLNFNTQDSELVQKKIKVFEDSNKEEDVEYKEDEIQLSNPEPVQKKIKVFKDSNKEEELNKEDDIYLSSQEEPVKKKIYIKQLEEDKEEEPMKENIIEEDSRKVVKIMNNEDTAKKLKEEIDNIKEDDQNSSSMEDQLERMIDDQIEQEEQLKLLQNSVKQKIKPVLNKVDLNSFTISKKPAALSSVLNVAEEDKVSDWILRSSKRVISMKEFKGSKIKNLDPSSYGRNLYNTYTSIYTLLYKNLSEPKPATMEQWVKILRYKEIDDIYFSVFKSSFEGSNYLVYKCDKCSKDEENVKNNKNIFITDNIPMEKMVKYKDDAAKKEVEYILQNNILLDNEYEIELVQLTDNIVIGFKEPTVYSVIFESLILDDEFRLEYKDILALLSYIDAIYIINRNDNTLRPLNYKEYENNPVKTLKSKIVRYNKVIDTLTTDEYEQFEKYIAAIDEKNDIVSYIIPEMTCPRCGHVIKETPISGENLLFTRRQLAVIPNMQVK